MVDAQGKAIPLEEIQESTQGQDAIAKLTDFYTYAKLPLPAEPPSIKSGFLEEGMAAGSDGYLLVPVDIPEEYKATVYKVVNFLLSDDQQIRLITTMWQYTGTDIWDKIPGGEGLSSSRSVPGYCII